MFARACPQALISLLATLKTVTGKKPNVKHGPARLGDIRSNYGDPAKAEQNIRF